MLGWRDHSHVHILLMSSLNLLLLLLQKFDLLLNSKLFHYDESMSARGHRTIILEIIGKNDKTYCLERRTCSSKE